MKKVKNFYEFINEESAGSNIVPSMGPLDYSCPHCDAKVDMNIYETGYNPVTCLKCGGDFNYPWPNSPVGIEDTNRDSEYPWPSTSWRWV